MLILSVWETDKESPPEAALHPRTPTSKQAKRRQAARLRSAVQVVGIFNFHLPMEGGYYDSRPLYQLSIVRENSLDRRSLATGFAGGPVRSSGGRVSILEHLAIESSGTGCDSGLSLTE